MEILLFKVGSYLQENTPCLKGHSRSQLQFIIRPKRHIQRRLCGWNSVLSNFEADGTHIYHYCWKIQ